MNTRFPTVVSTSPSNYQRDIPINTSIRVEFNIDLDQRYINPFVLMADSFNRPVEIRASYRSKVITITPLQPLSMGTTYHVTLVGDSDLEDGAKQGIRSIIGDCMAGNSSFTFSTEQDITLAIPELTVPINNSIVRSKPAFQWTTVENAAGYHFELSKSNLFGTFIYPQGEHSLITDTMIEPDAVLDDGLYYSRLRSVREDGRLGEWSKPYQFNLRTVEEGTIAEEDTSIGDEFPYYDSGETIELEVVENFPEDLGNYVPTNVKSLYFRVIGDIDLGLLDSESLTLIGQHISGDFQEESHGLVKGRITVVDNGDGTAYVVFTPEPLPIEGVGEI